MGEEARAFRWPSAQSLLQSALNPDPAVRTPSRGFWDTTPCKVTPVILHGAVSSDVSPCRMTGVTLDGVVFPERRASVKRLTAALYKP